MVSSGKELEQQLMEAGNRLLEPPSSPEELLPLLDKVESFLSNVEQTPSDSMKNALSPALKALIGDKLLRHPDMDVKVAVASCISEITRITAPDAPYEDERMKEVFKLIIASFEDLPDKSSRSYTKRTSMLEVVAKVRSCVVMLDLECDALIVEMFQYFLKAIRDYHPQNVFSSMETIMTLIIEESEDISVELLSPLLSSLRKDDKEVLPIARKLAENVIQSCATKLKPYLIQAIKCWDASLDHYTDVVESICGDRSVTLAQNEVATTEDAVDKVASAEAVRTEQVDVSEDKSLESVFSNGVAQTGKDNPPTNSASREKQEPDNLGAQPMDVDKPNTGATDIIDPIKTVDADHGEKQTTDNGESEYIVAEEGESVNASLNGEDQAKKLPENEDLGVKDPSITPVNEPTPEIAASSENEKGIGEQLSTPKLVQDGSAKVPSPSLSGSHQDETLTKKTGNRKKQGVSIKKTKLSVDDVRKASEEAIDTEAKAEDTVDGPKKRNIIESCYEEKPLKLLGKKVDAKDDNSDNASKQKQDKKNKGQGRASNVKRTAKDEDKLTSSTKSAARFGKAGKSSEETPDTSSKRKRVPGKESTSDVEEYGENLLGSRIKVWWPKDRRFYEGVVDSYDSAKRKHLVLYDDGDQEILNLKRQRWELIEGSREEKAAGPDSPDVSPEMPKRKKAKTSFGQSSKQGKMSASAKSGGEGASAKSKAVTSKSGKRSKDHKVAESKSKESSKTVSKREEDSSDEGEGQGTNTAEKSSGAPLKSASKAKKDEISKEDNNKSANKSKQETSKSSKSKESLKSASGVKSKHPQKSAGKSNVKAASDSETELSKTKEKGEKYPTDSAKAAPEKSRGKSPGSSKVKGSDTKSGKKRAR